MLWKTSIDTEPIKAQAPRGSSGAATAESPPYLDLALEVQVVADPRPDSESWNDILTYQSPELTVDRLIEVETLNVQARDPLQDAGGGTRRRFVSQRRNARAAPGSGS